MNADRAIKACLLKPNAIDVAELPLDLLPMSLDEAMAPAFLPPWFWSSRALLAYRSGDAELAVTNVKLSEEKTPNDHCHALNLAVLAMAQHQLANRKRGHSTFLVALADLVVEAKIQGRASPPFLSASEYHRMGCREHRRLTGTQHFVDGRAVDGYFSGVRHAGSERLLS